MATAKTTAAGNVKLKLSRDEAQALINILNVSSQLLNTSVRNPTSAHDEDGSYTIWKALHDAGLDSKT